MLLPESAVYNFVDLLVAVQQILFPLPVLVLQIALLNLLNVCAVSTIASNSYNTSRTYQINIIKAFKIGKYQIRLNYLKSGIQFIFLDCCYINSDGRE